MKLLRSEITKLLFQKRTYVGWAGLVAIPMLMTLALRLNEPTGHGDQGPGGGFFVLAAHNGLIVPVAAIAALSAFLLPLVSAMAGGFQLAGEAESGTIKTWLVHPVSRGGVLVSKWVAAVLYVFAGMVLVAVSSYAVGSAVFGVHSFTLLSGNTVSVAQGLWLTLLIYLYLAVAMTCMISLAMLLSTISDSSLTAAVGTLVLYIVLNVLGSFGFFDFLKPYLFTSHFDAWMNLFQQHVDWWPIEKGLLVFASYIGVATLAAWALFRRKDVLA